MTGKNGVHRPTEATPIAEQYTLPYSNPTTSKDAASSMKVLAAEQRALVYHYICTQGERGATDEEIQEALGLRVQSETPRRGELVLHKLVLETEQRRRTRSGRWAIVWWGGECQCGHGTLEHSAEGRYCTDCPCPRYTPRAPRP